MESGTPLRDRWKQESLWISVEAAKLPLRREEQQRLMTSEGMRLSWTKRTRRIRVRIQSDRCQSEKGIPLLLSGSSLRFIKSLRGKRERWTLPRTWSDSLIFQQRTFCEKDFRTKEDMRPSSGSHHLSGGLLLIAGHDFVLSNLLWLNLDFGTCMTWTWLDELESFWVCFLFLIPTAGLRCNLTWSIKLCSNSSCMV